MAHIMQINLREFHAPNGVMLMDHAIL